MLGNSEDDGNIVDICGDYLQKKELHRTSGYIESLDYPYIYSSNSMCSCNLSMENSQGEIILNILDLSLNAGAGVQSGSQPAADWLEYAQNIDYWGRGRLVRHEDIGREIRTGMSTLMINFNSDSTSESRGFWMRYQGIGQQGQEERVKITCGTTNPPSK